jgi:hypothetical protein
MPFEVCGIFSTLRACRGYPTAILLVQVHLNKTEETMYQQLGRQLRLVLGEEAEVWEQLPPDRKAHCLELLVQLLNGIKTQKSEGDESHDDQ